MADTKISALAADDAVGGSEQIPVNDAGTNKRITPTQIIAYLLSVAREFLGAVTLSGGYIESGATLTQSGGTLTIPLNGKIYQCTPSEAITTITLSGAPTAPLCSSAIVYFNQGATGYAVSFPSTWRWPNGMPTPISTVANATTRLVLSSSPSGAIHADAEVRATYS